MFTATSIAIRQLFAAITVLFSAAEKASSAINHLATWSDETAGNFADEARIQRTAKRRELEASTGVHLVGNSAIETTTGKVKRTQAPAASVPVAA